jgi:hypothetical protein
MIVAAAPDSLSFVAKSSKRDHGGMHPFNFSIHTASGKLREFTAYDVPSLHLALQRGSWLFFRETIMSVVCLW